MKWDEFIPLRPSCRPVPVGVTLGQFVPIRGREWDASGSADTAREVARRGLKLGAAPPAFLRRRERGLEGRFEPHAGVSRGRCGSDPGGALWPVSVGAQEDLECGGAPTETRLLTEGLVQRKRPGKGAPGLSIELAHPGDGCGRTIPPGKPSRKGSRGRLCRN